MRMSSSISHDIESNIHKLISSRRGIELRLQGEGRRTNYALVYRYRRFAWICKLQHALNFSSRLQEQQWVVLHRIMLYPDKHGDMSVDNLNFSRGRKESSLKRLRSHGCKPVKKLSKIYIKWLMLILADTPFRDTYIRSVRLFLRDIDLSGWLFWQ